MKHFATAAKSSLIIAILASPAWSFLTPPQSSSSHSYSSSYSSTTQRPMATDAQIITTSSWDDLVHQINATPVGTALTNEVQLRKTGQGSAHVHNTLRTFDDSSSENEVPPVILYRDHAGWCVRTE